MEPLYKMGDSVFIKKVLRGKYVNEQMEIFRGCLATISNVKFNHDLGLYFYDLAEDKENWWFAEHHFDHRATDEEIVEYHDNETSSLYRHLDEVDRIITMRDLRQKFLRTIE